MINWINAARLRTLPLSLSGIVVGSFVAYKQGFWDTSIFVLALLTTLFLQVLSNFANDLGDSYKGADNTARVGPQRAIQSGKITQRQMILGVTLMALLSLATAIPLILIGTSEMSIHVLWTYILLAFLCVGAAITYTIGKKAYGYHGWGDVMVFIFFGCVSVLGVYTLYSKQFDWSLLFFAICIGLLSIAVLNLNNMRDYENDKAVGKKTIVVKMGFRRAKLYQTSLIVGALVGLLLFIGLKTWWWSLIALIPFVFLLQHLIVVWKTTEPRLLDPELKKVALSTFLIAILFSISTMI